MRWLYPAGAILLFKNLYPNEAFVTIGWRMPLLVSPLLLIVGIYIRLRIPETLPFAQLQAEEQQSKAPLLDAFRYHWREVLLCGLMRTGDQVSFYIFIFFVFTDNYTKQLQMEHDPLYKVIIMVALIEVLVIPVVGMASDHIGRKRCYLIGSVATACLAFPYFMLLNTKNVGLIVLALILVLVIGHASVYAPLAALVTERFSTKVRYTGASLGYQLLSLAGGGLAPIVANYLVARLEGQAYIFMAIYVIAMSVISVCAVLPLKEYAGKPPAEV
jgi:MFS family permease